MSKSNSHIVTYRLMMYSMYIYPLFFNENQISKCIILVLYDDYNRYMKLMRRANNFSAMPAIVMSVSNS